MAWYVIDMPEASLTDGAYHRFCREFQRAFIDAGAPAELALFAERNGISDARRLFLSPVSHAYVPHLVSSYGARPCMVPDPASVTLVYGVPGAKTLLEDAEPVSVEQYEQMHGDAPPKRKEAPAIYPISRGRSVASGG